MFDTSTIHLNKSALEENIRFIRNLTGEGVKFSSVVKGNAYGHGVEKMVPMLEELGVDHFSVFDAHEALEVKEAAHPDSTIMIMGYVEGKALEWAVENDIQFYIFETDRLQKALEISKKTKKTARIHLELETGMNRTGLSGKELKKAVEIIKANPQHFSVEGVCTHYAGAESIANHLRVKTQYQKFNRKHKWLLEQGIKPKLRHTACSAATISYPETKMDMVRVGIIQYGLWPSRETFIHYVSKKKEKEDPLRRVISWKSRIMSIKKVKTGEFIGYGTTFMAPKDMEVAIVPVGYAYGYSRGLSNLGRVLVNGSRVAVIGIVNMNMLMLDVSLEAPQTKKGDEVVLIGRQGDLDISIASFSEMSAQLNYESLTRLPKDVPRIIV